MHESLKTAVALGMAGIDVLPTRLEEVDAQRLVRETFREQDAFREIVARLMAVDAEHPELHIRLSLQTLYARAQGGADLTEDLRALIKHVQPFLER